MRKKYLFSPGPTTIPPEVLQAMARPIIHHRVADYEELAKEVIEGIKYVFQTKNDILLFAASGTGGMESAVVNTLSPGDTALVVSIGVFGDRWAKILDAFGVRVEKMAVEWGWPADPSLVKGKLEANPQIKAVFTTLTETSTGIVNDIASIGAIVKDYPAFLVVDAVSGIGGVNLATDGWQVDVVVAGSQKAFMIPPGIAMVSVSEKAWKAYQGSRLSKFYWDFATYRKTSPINPYTPPISLMYALQESLRQIRSEGLENIFQRHQLLAVAARAGVEALGLEVFNRRAPANVVTVVKVPETIDGAELFKHIRDKYGITMAGGQEKLKGKILRIAHMGYVDKFDIIIAISALEMAFTDLGYSVPLGEGIKAVENIFLA